MKRLINWLVPDIVINDDYTYSLEVLLNQKPFSWNGAKTFRIPRITITGYQPPTV